MEMSTVILMQFSRSLTSINFSAGPASNAFFCSAHFYLRFYSRHFFPLQLPAHPTCAVFQAVFPSKCWLLLIFPRSARQPNENSSNCDSQQSAIKSIWIVHAKSDSFHCLFFAENLRFPHTQLPHLHALSSKARLKVIPCITEMCQFAEDLIHIRCEYSWRS